MCIPLRYLCVVPKVLPTCRWSRADEAAAQSGCARSFVLLASHICFMQSKLCFVEKVVDSIVVPFVLLPLLSCVLDSLFFLFKRILNEENLNAGPLVLNF